VMTCSNGLCDARSGPWPGAGQQPARPSASAADAAAGPHGRANFVMVHPPLPVLPSPGQ
jgi:hypothetical protein